jgi:hypothetical protein
VKKPQTRGESGLLRVPYGGNLWWGGKTHQKNGISLLVERRDDFLPQLVNLNLGKVAHAWPSTNTVQTKERRPTAARGWAPEARYFCAHAGRDAGTRRITSSARRGALPMKSDVIRF